jgi:hypothetical protein
MACLFSPTERRAFSLRSEGILLNWKAAATPRKTDVSCSRHPARVRVGTSDIMTNTTPAELTEVTCSASRIWPKDVFVIK